MLHAALMVVELVAPERERERERNENVKEEEERKEGKRERESKEKWARGKKGGRERRTAAERKEIHQDLN